MKRIIIIASILLCLIATVTVFVKVGCASNNSDKVNKEESKLTNDKAADDEVSEEIIKSIDLRSNKKIYQEPVKKEKLANKKKRSVKKYKENYGRIIDLTSQYLTIKNRYKEQKIMFSDNTLVYNKKEQVVDRSVLDICQVVRIIKLKSNKKFAKKIYILKESDCLE